MVICFFGHAMLIHMKDIEVCFLRSLGPKASVPGEGCCTCSTFLGSYGWFTIVYRLLSSSLIKMCWLMRQ